MSVCMCADELSSSTDSGATISSTELGVRSPTVVHGTGLADLATAGPMFSLWCLKG